MPSPHHHCHQLLPLSPPPLSNYVIAVTITTTSSISMAAATHTQFRKNPERKKHGHSGKIKTEKDLLEIPSLVRKTSP
jgi:hypothetical protein